MDEKFRSHGEKLNGVGILVSVKQVTDIIQTSQSAVEFIQPDQAAEKLLGKKNEVKKTENFTNVMTENVSSMTTAFKSTGIWSGDNLGVQRSQGLGELKALRTYIGGLVAKSKCFQTIKLQKK